MIWHTFSWGIFSTNWDQGILVKSICFDNQIYTVKWLYYIQNQNTNHLPLKEHNNSNTFYQKLIVKFVVLISSYFQRNTHYGKHLFDLLVLFLFIAINGKGHCFSTFASPEPPRMQWPWTHTSLRNAGL